MASKCKAKQALALPARIGSYLRNFRQVLASSGWNSHEVSWLCI